MVAARDLVQRNPTALPNAGQRCAPSTAGSDERLRLAASIRTGRVSAALALQRFGFAARGGPVQRAADRLGRRLRLIYLCNCLAVDGYWLGRIGAAYFERIALHGTMRLEWIALRSR